MISKNVFPDNFAWGAAAAAYQIEGAVAADGKGPSVWDMMCQRPGKIWNGQSGELACDHYKHYREDVALMKQLGLKAYRFSFSWPRILPQGTGAKNESGLAFYDRLIDALLEAGIQPWATMFHWDYPYALYCQGGWLNPDSPKWFAEYSRVLVDRYSDRVAHWMTVNEPQCFIGLGHRDGMHAPGDKLGMPEVFQAAHNALLAHGRAVSVIRERARLAPSVGWAPAGMCFVPETETPADIEAARQAMFDTTRDPIWGNAWWADPVMLGQYPEEGMRKFSKQMPSFNSSDMQVIHQPLDFYGVNIYGAEPVRAGKDGRPETVHRGVGHPHSHFVWNVEPRSLYWGPRFLWERYKTPVVIAENGMSNVDWVSLDGKVHDPQRIDFLARYLAELRRAHRDGVALKGYFVWSLMDNFEWAEGYKHRFGLVYVDYTTQKRVPKDSAFWYRDVIASKGSCLPENGEFH